MKISNQISTSIAIIAAGAMIAGAVIYSDSASNKNTETAKEVGLPTNGSPSPTAAQPAQNAITPKNGPDSHVLGSPEAPITIVTYSDIECPYCRQFHKTMLKVIDVYGKTGQVKWEYRHYPLEMLHPTAPKEAEATECAAEMGGNTKFWEYLNDISTNTLSKTDITSELVKVAVKLGLNESAFRTCLTSNKYAKKIQDSIQEGTAAGVQGTPNGTVIGPNGKTASIPGAYPFENVDQIIKQMLAQ